MDKARILLLASFGASMMVGCEASPSAQLADGCRIVHLSSYNFIIIDDGKVEQMKFGEDAQICETDDGKFLKYGRVKTLVNDKMISDRFVDGTLADKAVVIMVPTDADATWMTYPYITRDGRGSTAPGLSNGVEISFTRDVDGNQSHQRAVVDCANNTFDVYQAGKEPEALIGLWTKYDDGELNKEPIRENTNEYWLAQAACQDA